MGDVDVTRLARLRVLDRLGAEIGRAVTALYTNVAEDPGKGFHFPTGRQAALLAGYTPDELEKVPPHVVDRFAGVGCPLRHAPPQSGEHVLDLGCGAGTDLFLAAHHVGKTGKVVGVDLTGPMIETCRQALEGAGVRHAQVIQGRAPRFDVEGPFDLVTSNGVLNLIPEKEAVLTRLHELLREDGRIVLSDIALSKPPEVACLANAQLWAECLVGAYTEPQYLQALQEAGFVDVQVHEKRDYFKHSDSEETRKTASDLGAFAWVVTAKKGKKPTKQG
jgi:arsenite methyltransferase